MQVEFCRMRDYISFDVQQLGEIQLSSSPGRSSFCFELVQYWDNILHFEGAKCIPNTHRHSDSRE